MMHTGDRILGMLIGVCITLFVFEWLLRMYQNARDTISMDGGALS
jgi:hypothetical protein